MFNMKNFALSGAMFVASLLIVDRPANAQTPLKYNFKNMERIAYRITITLDLPNGLQRTTGYVDYLPIVGKDSMGMPYMSAFRTTLEHTGETSAPFVPPQSLFANPDREDHQILFDRYGKAMNSRFDPGEYLPGSIGSSWELALPPLPADGSSSWSTSEPIVLIEKAQQQQRSQWPAPSPQRHAQSDSDMHLSSRRTNKYTAAPAQGDLVTVTYTTDLATDEKTGDVPMEHETGEGSFVFDLKQGAVRSLSAKMVDEVNLKNVTVKVPITLEVTLLSPDELKKLKADSDAVAAVRSEQNKKARATFEERRRYDVHDLPDDMTKTAIVGGNGGGPFMKIDPDHRPLLGFRIRIGSWGGDQVLGNVDPLYEKPTDMHPTGESVAFARDGYAVGGLWMNGSKYAYAMRVIFMKKTANGLDPKQAYVSPWYGVLKGPERIKLGGTGEIVAGEFGLQGLNTNGLGLILQKRDPTDDPNFKGTATADPTDDPNYKGTPAGQ